MGQIKNIIIIIIISILFYFYSNSKPYYKVYFKTSRLDGISIDSKIRHQGSISIGKIVEIKRQGSKYLLTGIVKPNFFISKSNSKISIKSWGILGSNFVNITPYSIEIDKNPNTIRSILEFDSSKNIYEVLININHTLSISTKNVKTLREKVRKLNVTFNKQSFSINLEKYQFLFQTMILEIEKITTLVPDLEIGNSENSLNFLSEKTYKNNKRNSLFYEDNFYIKINLKLININQKIQKFIEDI